LGKGGKNEHYSPKLEEKRKVQNKEKNREERKLIVQLRIKQKCPDINEIVIK
jgi:hypothetical protein